MYRIAFLIIFSCIVSAYCMHELLAQPPEGRQGGGQRGQGGGQRPGGGGQPPGGGGGGQRPGGGQQAEGEQPAADPEGGEEPPKPVVPPPPPSNSLAKILKPEFAQLIHLTAEQAREATRIISVQVEEISRAHASNAPVERYEEIYKQTEGKLKALLTPSQQAVLELGLDTKKFRISFQGQPWKDVLQMIADQGGYHLMMDAPPPATFNYTSAQEFTIIEVLDLVNSVLIINGFTVTRKDRIMLVLDLKKPIPNWSFPSERPENLAGRASSEYVSVIHQMGRRDPAAVMPRVKQLESQFSRITQMGNQVLVIDRVEIQIAVKNAIESIPPRPEDPPRPPQEQQRGNPPPPEWRKYTSEKLEPEKILEIFKEYVPNIKVLRLDDSKILNIFVQPGEHRRLEELLKMMEADADAMSGGSTGTGGTRKTGTSAIRSYSITPYMEPQGIPIDLRMLQRMQQQRQAPPEGYTPGQGGGRGQGGFGPGQRGPVGANGQRGDEGPRGQGRQFGGGFGGGGSGQFPPVIPPGVDPSQLNQTQRFGLELISVLRRMFPEASFLEMPFSDRIVIMASDEDHEQITEFLESLKPTGADGTVLKVYRFADASKKMTDTTVMQLQALVPTAVFALDAEQSQMMVVATAKEHVMLTELMKELEAVAAPKPEQFLVPYRLSATTLPAFQLLIQQLAAQEKLRGYSQVQDMSRNQVLIWATVEQHNIIQDVFTELTEQRKDDTNFTRTYPIAPYMEGAAPDLRAIQRLQMQQQRVPGEGFIPGQGGPGQRGQRGQFGGGGGGAPLVPVIPQGVDPNQLNQVQMFGLQLIAELRRAFPDISISDVPISEQIVITASEAEHKRIEEFLEALKPTGEKAPALKIISFADPTKKMTDATLQQLQALVPTAQMTLDAEKGQIMVVATAKEHTAIAGLVKELESATTPVQEGVLRPYQLSANTIYVFTSLLEQLANQNKLPGYYQAEDYQRNAVLIWATPEQHALIQKVHADVTGQSGQASGAAAVADVVVTFGPRNISMETLLTVIEDIYPTAKITQDERRKSIIIRIRPEQKEPLELLLKQLDADEPGEEKRYYKSYPIETAFYSLTEGYNYYRPMQFLADLEKLAPRATIIFDPQTQALIVWGTDEEQKVIEEAVKHLMGDGKEKVMERMHLRRMNFFSIRPILVRLYPGGTYTQADEVGRTLIVEGHPKLLVKVKELIELLDPEEPSESDPIVMFYKFEKEPTYMMLQGLQRLVSPQAVILPDTGNKQIMVIAKPSEQKIIEKSTELIVKSFKEPEKELRRFQLRRFPQWVIEYALRRKFPDVNPMSDYAAPGLILVEGDPLSLAKVEEFLNVIDPLEPTENDPVIMYYTLKTAPTVMMLNSLRSLAPTAQIATDWENERIMVVAKPSDHELIKRNTESIADSFAEPDRDIKRFTPNQMTAYQLQSLIRRTYPSATITFDNSERYLVVQAHPELMQKITAMIETIDPSGPTGRELKRFIPNRMGAYQMQTVIRRMYPTATASYDSNERYLVVEATPELMPKITELVETLDPAEPTDTDPVAKFYALKSEPTPTLIQGFQQLAPRATIIPDRVGKQVMVVARPLEHKIIEASVEVIVATSAPPEESVLAIYAVTRDERDRLESFIRTLQQQQPSPFLPPGQQIQPELRDVRIIPERGAAQPPIQQDVPFPGRGGQVPANRITIYARPTEHEMIAAVLEQIRESQANAPERKLKVFPMSVADVTTAQNILRTTNPDAMPFPDPTGGRLMVWTTADDMEKVIEALAMFDVAGEGGKEFRRFQMNRMPYWRVQPVIMRMYPAATVTYDNSGQFLIIEATPNLLDRIAELLAILDPAEPTENDPIVKFYALETEPTQILLQSLRQLVPPPAVFTPDREGKQIMVLAKPAEHKLIESNVKLILSTFTPLEEPVLVIYTTTNDERERLTSFIETAATTANLRGVQIIPDGLQEQANRTTIYARPTEHKMIAAILKQFQKSQANAPERQLKVFPMSVGDMDIAQEVLQTSHPDAMLFPDSATNRLMVWATADDMKRVTETLLIQGNIDDRQMMPYPIAGASLETAKSVITDVFLGLKITEEPLSRKLLVWASPEEHVKVAEIIEQVNKETDPESELAEKFLTYSAHNLDIAMLMQLFPKLLPNADIHATPGSDKIVIRAIARDHQRIDKLFEQLREKDDALKLKLSVYPFDDTDPVMVEALLQNQLSDAESMSPDDLLRRLGGIPYQQRMNAMYANDPWMLRNYPQMAQMQQTAKIGYYKVDPLTRTVYILATEEQHKDIKDAIEQLILASNQEDIKPTIRRYMLEENDDIMGETRMLIQQIVPSVSLHWIYTRVQDPYYGWYDYRAYEFLAYTRESEHEKLEQLVKELNDRSGISRKEMLTISLPERSPYSRERVIETLQRVYKDIEPMPGGAPNQLLVWASSHRLEQIKKTIADICQPLEEGAQTILVSYPLQYISVEEATAWLAALYPNASFDPSRLTAAQQTQAQRRFPQGLPAQRLFPRPDGAKILNVVATPLEHVEIEKTITELDKELPDSLKMLPRSYALDDLPPGSVPQFNAALTRAFPNAVVTPQPQAVMVVAAEEEHKKIADFIAAYREDSERMRPETVIYTLKRLNYYQVSPLLQLVAPPPAWIGVGSKPDSVIVRGTSKEQKDVAEALAQLETAAETVEPSAQQMKVYKAGADRAAISQWLLNLQFPGTLVLPINQNEILVWGSPMVHDAIEPILEQVSLAFPDPVFQAYVFKNIPLGEAATILQNTFVGQAQITPRPATGDLLVFATPDVQAKITASIANLDAQRPADVESSPKYYDLSELPLEALAPAMIQMRAATQYRAIISQGVVPGQMIVWARPGDHEKIAELVEHMLAERTVLEPRIFDISDLPPALLPQAAAQIQQALQNRIQVLQGIEPGQLIVHGKLSDLEKVEKIVTQMLTERAVPEPRIFDLSDLPPALLPQAAAQIQQALQNRIQVLQGVEPGQLIVHGKLSDLEKVEKIVTQMLTERSVPEMQIFDLSDLPVTMFATAAWQIQQVLQNRIQAIQGAVPGQLVVIGKSSDLERVEKIVEQMLTERSVPETKTFDLSDLPPSAFYTAAAQIQQALQGRVQALQGVVPGQLIVHGKLSDLEKVAKIVEQMLNERTAASAVMQVYTVQRGNARTVADQLILQIAPNARSYPGTSINQVVVWAKPSDHVKIDEAIGRLNESDPDVSLKIYRTGTQRAATAQAFLAQQFPGLLIYPMTPNELAAWATSAEHETIGDLLKTVAEAYPDPVAKTYYFKHVPLNEGWGFLWQAFSTSAQMMSRPTTDDLLVYATPEVHERIEASIAGFDVARPADAEYQPRTYDLSDLPTLWFNQAVYSIQTSLGNRVFAAPGVVPGQLVVTGKSADLEKVDMIVGQMLAELPSATATMQVYTLQRTSNMTDFRTLLPFIAPTAKPSADSLFSTNPNQISIFAKAADHVKIKETVDKLNESEPDIVVELHPLKNIESYTSDLVLNGIITRKGLDIRFFTDSYSDQYVVLARPEDQIMVAELLDKLRSEDRILWAATLVNLDAITAQNAVNTMFVDEPINTRPRTNVDMDTNILFILGFPNQLEQAAKLLRDMNEDVWYPNKPEGEPRPGNVPQNIRQIRVGPDALREVQKIWNQTQPNPLQIIKEETPPSLFSLEDEIQREEEGTEAEAEEIDIADDFAGLVPSAPPVYIAVNPDGSLLISSSDTKALDQLEAMLKRINSGIVWEGRDYTIFSVRNISANVIVMRLNQVLRNKILQQQQQRMQPQVPGTPARPLGTPLSFQPDAAGNTITVWGSKADRQEVAKLIQQFDVSELPGERPVLKPVKVLIENTEATRVYNEVMKIYQSKLRSIQLPGGVIPQILVNNTTNELEILAPEPLATELKEYIQEVDERAVDEPGRKFHVYPLKVRTAVLQQAIQQLRQPSYSYAGGMQMPYMQMPYMQQPYMQMPMMQQPYMQQMPMMQQQQPFGRAVPRQF